MPRCPHCDQEHAENAHFCPVTGRPFGDMAERMIGRTLGGKYRLERAIGQGGMGTIFEATHVAIGSKVAVKLLHQAFSEKREPAQRLYREARATGAIGHPGIIKVFDVDETAEGTPFLVMELLEGESLGNHIDRLGPRPLGFALGVGIQMLSALHAAHEAGIIHRDLKSDNVFLLAGRGDDLAIKILDFGISKFTTPEGENLRLTQTGSVLGTPYYMAPEQARGVRDLDRRVDVYAAGVILYELLLGTIPRRSSNYNALLIEIITEDVPPFRQLRSDIPERLESAVLRALARNRDLRWPDARQLMEELEAIRECIPAHVLRGDPPPVDRFGALRWTHDSETVDYDSLPAAGQEGATRLAFEASGHGKGSGITGPRRRILLAAAAGLALISAAILVGVLGLGGGGSSGAPLPAKGADPSSSMDPGEPSPEKSGGPPPGPIETDGGTARIADAGPEPEPAAIPEPAIRPAATGGRGKRTASSSEKAEGSPGGSGKKPAKGSQTSGKGRPALDRPMDNPF